MFSLKRCFKQTLKYANRVEFICNRLIKLKYLIAFFYSTVVYIKYCIDVFDFYFKIKAIKYSSFTVL